MGTKLVCFIIQSLILLLTHWLLNAKHLLNLFTGSFSLMYIHRTAHSKIVGISVMWDCCCYWWLFFFVLFFVFCIVVMCVCVCVCFILFEFVVVLFLFVCFVGGRVCGVFWLLLLLSLRSFDLETQASQTSVLINWVRLYPVVATGYSFCVSVVFNPMCNDMQWTINSHLVEGTRCSSVVRAFAHGAMGRRIDPSWGGPIELFLVPASAPRLV